MATYGEVLEQAQLLQLHNAIESFLDSYAKNKNNPEQRTFIFFPGGMGSELVRAGIPFDPLLGAGQYNFQTLWVDFWKLIVDDDALLLQMNGNQDSGNQFVVSDGPLKYCGKNFYEGLVTWCNANNLDLLMVGWDFRRDATWNVDFFLQTLIPAVQARATARGLNQDVFQNAVLVGHSFGGMLVKWILNRYTHPFCQKLRQAITVATPFYGSAGQVERLFVSMSPLTPPHYDLDEITKTISTLPGPYSLYFLDAATYGIYGSQLKADKDFPLKNYPCVDKSHPNVAVDPYQPPAANPQNPNLYRYPIKGQSAGNDWSWFAGYLAQGLLDYQALATPLDKSVRSKLHNIRGVQTTKGAIAPQTNVGYSWGWYDVTRPRLPQATSVIQMTAGAGDTVVPAWSARLVTQDPPNIHTIRGDKDGKGSKPALEHMTLMDYPAVRLQLLELIRPGVAQVVVQIPTLKPATVTEYADTLKDLAEIASTSPPPQLEARIRTYINGISLAQQQALMLRWIIEAPKGALPAAAASAR